MHNKSHTLLHLSTRIAISSLDLICKDDNNMTDFEGLVESDAA